MIPFIDAHHHLWDPVANPHPWLARGARIPFRYGNYEGLKRPFLSSHYRALAARQNVIASVTMEGEWEPSDPLGETQWLSGLEKTGGIGVAHVSQAWLDAPDIGDVLRRLSRCSIVRGVRHKPVVPERGERLDPGTAGSLQDPAFAGGYALLAAHGFSFDLQAPWWALDDAAALAARHDDVPIILNHAGLPADRSAEGLKEWAEAVRRFAELPQARVKISGLGLLGHPWRVEDNRPIVMTLVEAFGAHRCMFASNFPVDGLCADFDTIIGGFRVIADAFSRSDQAALLHETAAETYRLEPA